MSAATVQFNLNTSPESADAWWPAMLDPDQVLAELRARFPGVVCWLGEYTGRWLAIRQTNGQAHLIEATTPTALIQLLEDAPPQPTAAAQSDIRADPRVAWTQNPHASRGGGRHERPRRRRRWHILRLFRAAQDS